MDSETLVRLSAVIVRGAVESPVVALDKRGDIMTWVTLRVEESLKGAEGHPRIAVDSGRRLGTRVSQVIGTPGFQEGERVIVFARRGVSGGLTVTGLFQGKFRIKEGAAGEEVV